jgi:general secretion pathway protein K
VEQPQRQALVDATLDWRDRDSLKHANGAEDDDYRRAGVKWAARDGAFSSVEEFRYVLGMTNQLYESLAPYLTVYSGQANVNLDAAPPWLLGVLSAVQDNPTTGNTAARGGSTFHITVWATSNGGSTASLDTVVRTAATGNRPYTILSWRAPSRSTIRNPV